MTHLTWADFWELTVFFIGVAVFALLTIAVLICASAPEEPWRAHMDDDDAE